MSRLERFGSMQDLSCLSKFVTDTGRTFFNGVLVRPVWFEPTPPGFEPYRACFFFVLSNNYLMKAICEDVHDHLIIMN